MNPDDPPHGRPKILTRPFSTAGNLPALCLEEARIGFCAGVTGSRFRLQSFTVHLGPGGGLDLAQRSSRPGFALLASDRENPTPFQTRGWVRGRTKRGNGGRRLPRPRCGARAAESGRRTRLRERANPRGSSRDGTAISARDRAGIRVMSSLTGLQCFLTRVATRR